MRVRALCKLLSLDFMVGGCLAAEVTAGERHSFYARAMDRWGNASPIASGWDAVVTVRLTPTPNEPVTFQVWPLMLR